MQIYLQMGLISILCGQMPTQPQTEAAFAANSLWLDVMFYKKGEKL